jgi:uncharacterized protein (TIGR04255 family)
MAVQRHLTLAPAREALIDIQFEPAAPLEAIERFAAEAQPKFKRSLPLWQSFIGFKASGETPETSASQAVIGRRLDSEDSLYVLQCRVSGFTFSRLSPYAEWKDLRDEAYRWWQTFRTAIQPHMVNRIAVRYINEIKLPMPVGDFAEYFTCSPRIPDALPQGLSSFLQRVVIPDSSNECVSIVTQALEGPSSLSEDGTSITVLLDVDVFRTVRLEGDSIEELWAGLDVLRTQKNRMFFEHLTEKTVEMFI